MGIPKRSLGFCAVAGKLNAVLATLVFCACSGYSATGGPGRLVQPPLTTEAAKGFNPKTLNVVAVMPFVGAPGKVLPFDTSELLTAQLVEALQAGTSLSVANVEKPDDVARVLDRLSRQPSPPQSKAQQLAREVGADGVLYGVVRSFTPAEATNQGELARVTFSLWLVEPQSGQTVWRATFHDEQQPLSENIFRLRQKLDQGGLRFQSSSEISRRGFRDVAAELERARGGVVASSRQNRR